jgi:hypothetical protein
MAITRTFLHLVTGILGCVLAISASAGPWPFPNEISVAEAYNRLYGTEYDENTFAGLQALTQEKQVDMRTLWTLNDFLFLEMLVFDTSSTAPFGIQVGSTFVPIYSPGPWTSPTRGWLPDTGPGLINLADVFLANSFSSGSEFSLRQGGVVLTANNTYRLETPLADQWLFAFNDNGSLLGGDKDANEPIFCAFNTVSCTQALSIMATVPLPGSLALAMLGLILMPAGRLVFKRPGRRHAAAL